MLRTVSLRLARTHDFPEGSAARGYEIVAPLDAEGRLDPAAWRRHREECRVTRVWADEPDRRGRLVHKAGGPNGATWAIDYDARRADDDEAGYRLESHRFAEGEYVSIRDEDGHLQTFRVTKVA